MSQATLDDDDLFDEAATEMRADVEEALGNARSALPDSDAIWEVDADNTLGALNGLRTALDTGDAGDHLRNAKKWYTMGERADAFDDADDLDAEIEELEEIFETIADAREEVSDLAATLPELRGDLEEAHEAAADADAGGGEPEAEAE
ncbi:MAG: DUF5790 family protein [Halobacteriales archaeon]